METASRTVRRYPLHLTISAAFTALLLLFGAALIGYHYVAGRRIARIGADAAVERGGQAVAVCTSPPAISSTSHPGCSSRVASTSPQRTTSSTSFVRRCPGAPACPRCSSPTPTATSCCCGRSSRTISSGRWSPPRGVRPSPSSASWSPTAAGRERHSPSSTARVTFSSIGTSSGPASIPAPVGGTSTRLPPRIRSRPTSTCSSPPGRSVSLSRAARRTAGVWSAPTSRCPTSRTRWRHNGSRRPPRSS